MNHRWSIRAQLRLLTLAVALPLAGLVAFTTWSALRGRTATQRASVHALAQLASGRVADVVSQARGMLARLTDRLTVHSDIRRLDGARCAPILTGLLPLHPPLANVELVDAEGRAVCSALPDHTGTASRERSEWFRRLLAGGEPVTSGPLATPSTGGWAVVLSHPVRDATGAVAGASRLSLDLGRLSEMLGRVDLPEGSSIVLLDEQEVVLARTLEPQRWVGRDLRGTAIVVSPRTARARSSGLRCNAERTPCCTSRSRCAAWPPPWPGCWSRGRRERHERRGR